MIDPKIKKEKSKKNMALLVAFLLMASILFGVTIVKISANFAS